MLNSRLIASVLTSLVVVGISTSSARQAGREASSRPLDAGATAVRLLLGIGDDTPEDWSGHVAVDKGEIVAVEGVRFREGDEVVGRDAWKLRSCEVRKVTAKKAARAAKKAAKAAKAAIPKTTGPSTSGASVFPNAVVITIKQAAGATLTVETAKGRFQVPLERLNDGSIVTALEGRAAAQRVFPHAPLVEGPLQQDFPAAVADGRDGAWIVYVEHEPSGPDQLPSLTQRPRTSPRTGPRAAATRSN